MVKMSELSIMNDYDDTQLMMCEKEYLIEYIKYIKEELEERDEELEESNGIIKKAEQHINTTCLSIPNETLDRIFRGIDDSEEE